MLHLKSFCKKNIRYLGEIPANRTSLFCCVFLILSSPLFGEEKANKKTGPHLPLISVNQQDELIVKGKVFDDEGLPAIGANILVKGSPSIGTITDFDGDFILKIPSAKSVLLISYIGFNTIEYPVLNNKKEIVLHLKQDNEVLDEVVVVAYGVQEKASIVGAISQVGNKSLVESGMSDITSALSGKMSGVLTMQQSGQPGSTENEIIIRGVSSWNGSKPLVMVDGVERDYSDLDPNEVNTISVLKDASATAVFGAKGANGVIIVTTKRGVKSKPDLNVSFSHGFEMPTRVPDHIDAHTTMSMYNVAMKNEGTFSNMMSQEALNEYKNPSSLLNSLKYPDVNWFDLVTKKMSSTTNANVNLRGGTEKVKYFLSLGYFHQGSLFDTFDDGGFCDTEYNYNRFNFRSNLDFSLSKSSKLAFNLGGDINIQKHPTSGDTWRYLYQTSSTLYPAYYPSWVLDEVPDLDYPDATGDRLAIAQNDKIGNPYSLFNQGSFNEYTSSKLFTDLVFNQDLDFITKGLSFTSKVSLSTYYKNKSLTANWTFPQYQLHFDRIGTDQNPWQRSGEGNETWTQPPLDINVGGLEGGYYSNLYYEFALNYKQSFGDHTVSALALMNRHQKNAATSFAYYNESWVGRATYNYLRKYIFEVNVGYTGSERFAPANRFGFFPSGAIGWVFSEEKFMKEHLPFINNLKFRYSDGKVGSDSASERWLYISDYSQSGSAIYEDKVRNPYAQWEEARKRDFGIELGLFDNLITAHVDFFDEKRTHMLLDPKSNTVLIGNNGFKQLNRGEMKKHGIELELGFNKTLSNDLNYRLKGIFGYNDNRIIYKDDLPYAPDYRKEAGKPYGSQNNGVVTTGDGYFTSIDDIHNNPAPTTIDKTSVGDYKFLDYTADGKISSLDMYPIEGTKFPPITYSFSGGFSYKNFDFNILFQGNVGKYVDFNQSFEVEFCNASWRVHESQLDYWSPTNPNANHSTLHFSGTSSPMLNWGGGEADKGYNLRLEDRFWRNASYLRLKEIYIGYKFDTNRLKEIAGISQLTLYATGNNLLTFTNLIEGDPERKDFSRGFYPQMATAKVGLRVNF